ncbi:hypothetical protein, partial [Klebsiella variicola]|uniref:hypothetical protein n=1 Tax=Klebsiella variicola TaxID=244366 RepID=UPI000E3DB097
MIKSTGPKFITEQTAEAHRNSLLAYRDYSGTAAVVRDYEKALETYFQGKRPARTVLTGMCYSAGSVMRQGSSSLTRLT